MTDGASQLSNENGKTRHESEETMIELKNIVKTYGTEKGPAEILKSIDFRVIKGEYVGITGKSGSGKSTLLNMLTAIDRPTSGEITINREKIHNLDENSSAVWRGKNIGIVFQFFQLLPALSVLDNVVLPMDFLGKVPSKERRKRAMDLLSRVDMAGHAHKLPSGLSGGEQQRVAIARALANDPPIIVADEPTGNLDSVTASAVQKLFKDMSVAGKTVLMVTHEKASDLAFDRVITLSDGKIIRNESRGKI